MHQVDQLPCVIIAIAGVDAVRAGNVRQLSCSLILISNKSWQPAARDLLDAVDGIVLVIDHAAVGVGEGGAVS